MNFAAKEKLVADTHLASALNRVAVRICIYMQSVRGFIIPYRGFREKHVFRVTWLTGFKK